MPSFSLILGFCPSEKDFKTSISKEDWEVIRIGAYGSIKKPCAGCGYSPDNYGELGVHIEECSMGEPDSAIVNLLCKACHAIRHFDMSAENGWVTLVNSVHSQGKLVEICREGRDTLMAEIDVKNIIILKSKDVKEYATDLKSGKIRHNDKIKVVFGKNFEWSSKKTQNGLQETAISSGDTT